MRMKHFGITTGILLSFLFLCGCGKSELIGYEELLCEEEIVTTTDYDWMNNGFRAMSQEQDALLYFTEFNKLTDESGDKFIPDEEWEIENPYVSDNHIYVDGLSVFYVMDEEDETTVNGPLVHYYMVFVDGSGKYIKKIDILPALIENRIFKSHNYRCITIAQDVGGYHYFWDNSSGTVLVLDSEGTTLFCERFEDYMSNEQIECIKTSEDEVIFARTQRRGARFVIPDIQALRFRSFFEIEISSVQKWHGLIGNKIYYSQSNKLKTWNIENGEVNILLDENEYSLNPLCIDIEPVPEGLDIFYHEGSKHNYYAFRKEEPVRESSITIANFSSDNDFLKRCKNSYYVENPDVEIDYEDCYSSSEKVTRVMMDVMKGEGPDILYITREDMENLAKNNALADLSLMLSEDNLNSIYSAVLNAGEIDGKVVGLPLYASMSALLVTDRYVTNNSWTTEDIIRIISEHDEELDGLFLWDAAQNYNTNLKILLGDDLFNSEFISNGKADFDNEQFKTLLKIIKRKTNVDNKTNPNDCYNLVKEGKYLGIYDTSIWDFSQYCSKFGKVGSEMHAVGLPGDNGRKIPLEMKGYIVVNHNSKDNDKVKDYINYLFGYEAQCMVQDYGNIGASVRNDMLSRNVGEYEGDYVLYSRSSGFLTYIVLMPTDAGELPIEDYESLWADSIYQNNAQEKIMDMILEEANGYFMSDKDLDDVVKSINKRVQLYLDENDL